VTSFSTCNILYCRFTLGKQQSFDAVDMCSPLMDQIVTLAVRAPLVFFIDPGNPHYGPDVAGPIVEGRHDRGVGRGVLFGG
jgi:hypothetical protein